MARPPWHALTSDEAIVGLDADVGGLSQSEAARRLLRYGPNRVALAKPTSAVTILINQLASLVVWLLLAAAAISLWLGDLVEAAAIAAVLVLNTGLGFVIDLRARRAMEALLQLDVSRCAVVRDGRIHVIDAHALVPGTSSRLTAARACRRTRAWSRRTTSG